MLSEDGSRLPPPQRSAGWKANRQCVQMWPRSPEEWPCSRDQPSWWLKEGWIARDRLIPHCAFSYGIGGQWQRDGKGRAFPGIALNLDTSTVPLHNLP